jgi:hypothetical protein
MEDMIAAEGRAARCVTTRLAGKGRERGERGAGGVDWDRDCVWERVAVPEEERCVGVVVAVAKIVEAKECGAGPAVWLGEVGEEGSEEGSESWLDVSVVCAANEWSKKSERVSPP